MNQFLWGALSCGTAVGALFFLRFWRESGDRLFGFFAAGFLVLSAHWTGLAVVDPSEESRHELYLLRLAAFVVLIVGILDKNARARAAPRK
jgi:hypothetical protein